MTDRLSWKRLRHHPRIWQSTCLGLLVTALSCGPQTEPPSDSSALSPGFQAAVSMEEVMRYMIDPAADAIWDSYVIEVTADGVVSNAPDSDEDWELLRRHAVTLTESTNLLLINDRPVAEEGSRSEMPGVDLEPEENEALLIQDRAPWTTLTLGLQATGVRVLEAVNARDLDALLVAGDELDLACENCHVRYWYPSLEGQANTR